ncbi:hypothetical protein ACINNAV18_A0008 (plasmid) [Acinetobacter baumannii Naval-18]|nr:hypothetical protein ACINNAV18_A0008 [Acinetobacter baumannii Naval-18]
MKEFNLDGYSSIELEDLIKAASLEKGKREIEEKVAAFGQLEEIAKSVGLTLDQLIEFGKTHNKKKKQRLLSHVIEVRLIRRTLGQDEDRCQDG